MATWLLNPSAVDWGGARTAYDFPISDPANPGQLLIASYGANCWIYNPNTNNVQGRDAALLRQGVEERRLEDVHRVAGGGERSLDRLRLPHRAARVRCHEKWRNDVDFTRIHDRVWNYDPAIGERMLRYGVDLADRFQGAFDGRASVMFAPHAIDTCSRPFLSDVEAERRRLDLRVMTHMGHSRIEADQVRSRDGMTPTEAAEDAGLLHDRLIAAHCLIMSDSDIARAGRAGRWRKPRA